MKGGLTKFQKVLHKTALKCVKIGHGNQFSLFSPSKIASFECKTRKADTTLLGFSIKKAIIMFASQFLLVSKDDGGRLCQKASTQNTCTQCNKAPFLLFKLLEVHYSTRAVLRRDAGLKMAKSCDACISKHASTKSQTKISRNCKNNTDNENWMRTIDRWGIKHNASSRGRRSAVGAPITAILASFESSISAEHFPTTRKDEDYLKPALSWVSRNVRAGP